MPGSTTFFSATPDDEIVNVSEKDLMSSRQPPPVAPRTATVSIQSWQSATTGGDHNYGDNRHARSASMDSLESSGSSSSGGGSSIANHRSAESNAVEFIPTRSVGKTPKLPSHNPLQFVKVQSPLYRKAEHQIKLTKEVKITREALKEGEEEWQSNLDNWKSRRRKVSEKVIQRAEEMRQIEAEEQLRQEQYQQQQRKIKKFSEIVEKRSTSRSYNLDLYIGQGDDSGLGGTPEPDDAIDSQNSILRSDTSEGMTSEAESIDSDIHKSEKIPEKEPPKVPQKPQTRFKDEKLNAHNRTDIASNNFSHLSNKDLSSFDNFSSTEPSDVEGHTGDSETISSEEDISYLSDSHKSQLDIKIKCDQVKDNCNGIQIQNEKTNANLFMNPVTKNTKVSDEGADIQVDDWQSHSFSICIKPGDSRGFGFTLKGGKDQGCGAYIDNVTKYGPADMTGIKEGDKIISLNGELAIECSHASLIFSVKQAMYTGILDIVIKRSIENAPFCSGVKTKSNSKKSSFAEKLALFSSGIKSNPASSEENKSLTSTKPEEGRSESLVLRRRSAFENGRNESSIVHRRSSCLSQGTSNISENVDKRLSVDLTLSQYNHQENGLVKKGPPPPVPVKPKLKPKTINDLQKVEPNKVNGCKNDTSLSNILNRNNSPRNESAIVVNSEKFFGNKITINETITRSENFVTDTEDDEKNESDSSSHYIYDELQSSQNNHYSDNADLKTCSPLNYNTEIPVADILMESPPSDNSKTVLENNLSSKINNITLDETFVSSLTNNTFVESLDCVPANSHNNENGKETEAFVNTYIDNAVVSESFTSTDLISENNISQAVGDALLSDTTPILPDTGFNIISNENISSGDSYVESNILQTQLACDVAQGEVESISSNLNLLETLNVDENTEKKFNNETTQDAFGNEITAKAFDNENSENSYDNETTEMAYDNEIADVCVSENVNNIDETDESINNIQSNPSPLCLPLEKIDEDDVISASTTTSSETPDTETVIETLPSNLSPLPNDESNGEESSTPLNCQDREMEPSLEIPVTSNDIAVSLCVDNLPNNMAYENVPIVEPFSSNDVDVNNACMYTEDQDDEYCRELDESIDQITSLDVIDEIEQRLMHQLEQQDESYEGMDECLTAQLEQDINKQWLYFSEEAELLDDLTPSYTEPPREPPPPPPPPEVEVSENQVMPMTRTNSTKRIKKELWRRRSDFLGLDSPEGIDVDNILPPPPGLEEILKQEREQNQWLEKRLSLAETDISAPLYSNETICVEPQDYIQSDYSEYFLEDTEDTTGDHDENWKENVAEQNVFESSSEMQYVPPIDMPSPISDENSKVNESPQHKAKQNIQNLGAAPKAKIMDSTKWITEKIPTVSRKSIEPVFSQTTYNQNYWLAQDDERKRNIHCSDNIADRRYSVPQFTSSHPDVTVRTWGDREHEFQKQRPRSAVWNTTTNGGDYYNTYSHLHKQDVLRTHSLESHREMNCDTNTLESEVHKCSCCGKGLCEGSAMGIEALRLYFHIECFRCCLCHMQLGNGSCGTDVQVKNNQLYCPRCFTVD